MLIPHYQAMIHVKLSCTVAVTQNLGGKQNVFSLSFFLSKLKMKNLNFQLKVTCTNRTQICTGQEKVDLTLTVGKSLNEHGADKSMHHIIIGRQSCTNPGRGGGGIALPSRQAAPGDRRTVVGRVTHTVGDCLRGVDWVCPIGKGCPQD